MPYRASVLIVDDDANVCSSLSQVLEKKGYDTTTIDSGQHAIELSKKKSFDAILMDVKMPVMGGVEAYKKIRQLRPSAVVIFMTAYSLTDLANDMIGEDAYAVIEKSDNIGEMIKKIEISRDGFLVTLVDADINIRNATQNALKENGYSVTVCKSGEEAIVLAKKRPQDIFFIDTELPILDAFETYVEIKKANPKAVVVLMTAYRKKTEEIVRVAIEKGAYSCLYKPFDINETVRIIEEIVKKKKK